MLWLVDSDNIRKFIKLTARWKIKLENFMQPQHKFSTVISHLK